MSCCKSVLTDWNHLGKLYFWPPRLYHLRKLVIPNSYLTFSTFQSLLVCSNPINREKVMIIGTQCTSGRILNTASDLGWWRSRKTLLIGYGAESWEMTNVKVIENFDTFPESTNMPSYDRRFWSYSHWNLREVLVLDRSNGLVKFEIYAHFQGNSGRTLNTKILENFITLLTVGRTQNFNLK
jgi:hypothetical protein